MRAEAWALLLGMVLLLPAATAYHGAEGSAGFVAEGGLDVQGDLRIQAAPAAALYAGPSALALSVDAAEARLKVVEVRERTDLASRLLGSPRTETVADLRLTRAHLTLFEQGAAMNALVFSEGLGRFHLHAPEGARLARGDAGAIAPTGDASRDGMAPERWGAHAFTHDLGVDHVRADAARSTLRATGDFQVFLYDAVASLNGAEGERLLRTGSFREGNEAVTRYALVTFRDGEARAFAEEAFRGLHARVLDYALDGALKGEAASGSAAVQGDAPRLSGPFVIRGVLTGHAEPAGERALRVQAEGDVVALSVPGVMRDYTPAPTVAAPLFALVAGVLAYYAPTLRFGAAVFLYSRFHGPRVLDHGLRDRALALLRERPGMSVKDVAAGLDVSWSTAAYHLDVLAREGFVIGAREGRHKRFHVAGERAPPAAAEHPTARRILESVRERPGLTQREVAEAAGIAPSTASWHLARLVEAGLLTVKRVWRERRYAPSPA